MYQKYYTKNFQKSIKKIIRSGFIKRSEIESVIDIIADGDKLPERCKDHDLNGIYLGYRECHIRSDLLLIYKIEYKKLILILVDVGSHSELF